MMNGTRVIKWALATVVMLAVVSASFFWNEARKEVVYLCRNFTAGVDRDRVLRQLDTGVFLDYRLQQGAAGSRIIADSRLNFRQYQCVVEFDSDGRVVHAAIQ